MWLIVVAMATQRAPTGTTLPAVSAHDEAETMASANQVGCTSLALHNRAHEMELWKQESTRVVPGTGRGGGIQHKQKSCDYSKLHED